MCVSALSERRHLHRPRQYLQVLLPSRNARRAYERTLSLVPFVLVDETPRSKYPNGLCHSVGVHCEIDVDDCSPDVDSETGEPRCFNGGRCVDRVGGYGCVCPPGYVGERCEGDVNECLSDPCDPNGSYNCVQLVNSYRCECRTGYTGMRAQTSHTPRDLLNGVRLLSRIEI